MFHCHILRHEDAGMMGQFLVLAPGQQPAPAIPAKPPAPAGHDPGMAGMWAPGRTGRHPKGQRDNMRDGLRKRRVPWSSMEVPRLLGHRHSRIRGGDGVGWQAWQPRLLPRRVADQQRCRLGRPP
ncbi:MAG: multicopper oxidase domain-containing protein [Nocardiopsaceae bacterium]|nr:multicopper oxidase domain-containing protein [Nocardiopsaceae bacterium]